LQVERKRQLKIVSKLSTRLRPENSRTRRVVAPYIQLGMTIQKEGYYIPINEFAL
jgi:hypothetical protein